MTKKERRNLEKINLRLFNEIVFERDNYKCRKCGSDFIICVHHIILKSQSSHLKYYTSNGIVLCQIHHAWMHSSNVSHFDKTYFINNLIGEELVEKLQAYKRMWQGRKIDLEEINRQLAEEKIKRKEIIYYDGGKVAK